MLKADYQVQLARDGAKALEIVTSLRQPPRLGVAVHYDARYYGFEVATRILRAHPSAVDTSHLCHRHDIGRYRIKGMDLGAVDFITKPVQTRTAQKNDVFANFMRYVEMRLLQAEYDDMVDAAQLRVMMSTALHATTSKRGATFRGFGMVQNLIQDEDIGHKQVAQLRLIEEASTQLLNMISLSAELYKIETCARAESGPHPIGEG